MANLPWYNENQFRDYPFVPRASPLSATNIGPLDTAVPGGTDVTLSAIPLIEVPEGLIVDAGFIMGVDSGYDESAGSFVYLSHVTRNGGDFKITFRVNVPDILHHFVTFEREIFSDDFSYDYQDSTTTVPDAFDPLTCPEGPRWSGFLVTGNMRLWGETFPHNGVYAFDPGVWQVETGNIQNLNNSFMRSVSVANTLRSTVDEAAGCGSLSSSSKSVDDVVINASCITGAIKFKEGFNCSIVHDRTQNQIIIGATVGGGQGEPCEEVPLSDTETPPDGSNLLSGGPSCGEVIQSINGVSGTNLLISTGSGFATAPHPTIPNRLVIQQTTGDFARCGIPETSSSSSSSEGF